LKLSRVCVRLLARSALACPFFLKCGIALVHGRLEHHHAYMFVRAVSIVKITLRKLGYQFLLVSSSPRYFSLCAALDRNWVLAWRARHVVIAVIKPSPRFRVSESPRFLLLLSKPSVPGPVVRLHGFDIFGRVGFTDNLKYYLRCPILWRVISSCDRSPILDFFLEVHYYQSGFPQCPIG